MAKPLTEGERKDLAVLSEAEQPPCTRKALDVRIGKAARQRAERRGHLAQSPEYTDCVVLTYDGIDYLEVLREFA
jgi:hypothetical protein